jgi:hypothetical protein
MQSYNLKLLMCIIALRSECKTDRNGSNLEKSINKMWLKTKCDNIINTLVLIKEGRILGGWT